MRQDIRQELRKYQMDKIKPNFTELGRQLGCDPRTAKKYYYLKEDGYENKRKRRKSKLDPYRNIMMKRLKILVQLLQFSILLRKWVIPAV